MSQEPSPDKHCEGLTQEQVERIAVAYFGGEVHREWCVAAINKALREDRQAVAARSHVARKLQQCSYCNTWVSKACGEGCHRDPARDPFEPSAASTTPQKPEETTRDRLVRDLVETKTPVPVATPRTDMAEFYAQWGTSGEGGNVVHAEDHRQLERELTASDEQRVMWHQRWSEHEAALTARSATPCIAPMTLMEMRAALRFYANDDHRVWVTFKPGDRERVLQRMKDEPGWIETGEDSRGHEEFIETGARAQTALNLLTDSENDAIDEAMRAADGGKASP